MEFQEIDWQQFVEQMSVAIDLPISPESLPGVIENLKKIAEVAHFVTEFPLPESIEISPIFTP